MSILVDTKYRSSQEEIMDDFEYDGPMLHDALDKLAKINQWLGGNNVTLSGLKKVIKNHPKNQLLTIVDLGCGGGDILRAISRFGKKNDYQFQLIGIDANEHTINYAQDVSRTLSNINLQLILV